MKTAWTPGTASAAVLANGQNSRVRVRRPEQFQVQQSVDVHVEGIPRLSRDDCCGCRRSDAAAEGLSRLRFLNRLDSADCILDRVISGAAAEIALEHARQVLAVFLVEGGRGHGQPGCTETALETLCVDQRLLHGMEFPIGGQSLDRRHLSALSAKGRHQATVDGNTIEPDCASSAIAGIASLLDSEPSQVAQEGAQALPGPWFRGESPAVDVISHEPSPAESSLRISSAK